MDEKGVVVLREYDDFEWLYHCLTTQNKVDAVVVSTLYNIDYNTYF